MKIKQTVTFSAPFEAEDSRFDTLQSVSSRIKPESLVVPAPVDTFWRLTHSEIQVEGILNDEETSMALLKFFQDNATRTESNEGEIWYYAPYPLDNDLNAYGDYDTLVLVHHREYQENDTYFKLVNMKKPRELEVPDEEIATVLLNFFREHATQRCYEEEVK